MGASALEPGLQLELSEGERQIMNWRALDFLNTRQIERRSRSVAARRADSSQRVRSRRRRDAEMRSALNGAFISERQKRRRAGDERHGQSSAARQPQTPPPVSSLTRGLIQIAPVCMLASCAAHATRRRPAHEQPIKLFIIARRRRRLELGQRPQVAELSVGQWR